MGLTPAAQQSSPVEQGMQHDQLVLFVGDL